MTTTHARDLILDEVALCAQACGLPEQRVRELAVFAREREIPLVEALVDRGAVNESQLLRKLSELMSLEYAGDEVRSLPAEVLASLSPALAMRQQVVPIDVDGETLSIVCSDPFNWQKWDELRQVITRPLRKVLCSRQTIDRLIKLNYGVGADTIERLVASRKPVEVQVRNIETAEKSEQTDANEPTVVNLVNQILSEAARVNATDIHLEPYENRLRVRYRVDGMLEDVPIPPSASTLKAAIVSRIKIMSNLDITEKRLPQDGRSQVVLLGQEYDLRVSILPGVYGEGVVLRLLSRQMVKLELSGLGFSKDIESRIRQLIARPHGLMLVTGPTGSGKTTTLYSCVHCISTPESKVITIEDPVEYWTENILQMQVHQDIGFSFARALRGMLRHDPDIMLVGEIRDRETADIAVRSALTGHLVFATLHTNNAAGAISRLVDIGIEPFLVASAVHGVLAQRLVRTICPNCKAEIPPESLDPYDTDLLSRAGQTVPYHGAGCEKCRFTGYQGRTAVGEVLLVAQGIRQLVQQGRPAGEIQDLACREGMRTLRQSALDVLADRRTTLSEVKRLTQEDL